MSNIDQFESFFRSSVREPFKYQAMKINKILFVCDLEGDDAKAYADNVKIQLSNILADNHEAIVLDGSQRRKLEDLLNDINSHNPDLICTYRSLYSEGWKYPYSLGEHADVMVQHTNIPVLMTPHPGAGVDNPKSSYSKVVVMTDHLAGEHQLINTAVNIVSAEGNLCLGNIEDQKNFDRIMDSISKIPSIDTDSARELLSQQLLKEASKYADSAAEKLKEIKSGLTVNTKVQFGHHLKDYKNLIEGEGAELLILNTKDDDQQAIHGLAYPLAVELRTISLLML